MVQRVVNLGRCRGLLMHPGYVAVLPASDGRVRFVVRGIVAGLLLVCEARGRERPGMKALRTYAYCAYDICGMRPCCGLHRGAVCGGVVIVCLQVHRDAMVADVVVTRSTARRSRVVAVYQKQTLHGRKWLNVTTRARLVAS